MQSRSLRILAQTQRALRRIGEARDGLLIFGALLYGAGYIAWSLYAWTNHLGPVAGLDAQYFIAGIPVVAVLLACWWIGNATVHFHRNVWPRWYYAQSARIQWVVLVLIIPLLLAAYVLYMYRFSRLGRPSREHAILDLVVAVAGVLVMLLVRRPSNAKPSPGALLFDRVTTRQGTVTIQIVVGIFALFGAATYLRLLYPKIPQVMGGAAPRRAVIDLSVERISPTTAELLLGRKALTAERVISSRPVLVYVASAESVLFSIQAHEEGKRWELFELKQDAIASIRWLQ